MHYFIQGWFGIIRPAHSSSDVTPSAGGSRFANHFLRLFIIAHGDEGAMPQVPGIRPFEKRHLADQVRFDPAKLSSRTPKCRTILQTQVSQAQVVSSSLSGVSVTWLSERFTFPLTSVKRSPIKQLSGFPNIFNIRLLQSVVRVHVLRGGPWHNSCTFFKYVSPTSQAA